MDQIFWLVWVPLDGISFFSLVNYTTQFGIICKLAEVHSRSFSMSLMKTLNKKEESLAFLLNSLYQHMTMAYELLLATVKQWGSW